MPRFRRGRRRSTAGKDSVKHGATTLDNIGSGVGSIGTFNLFEVSAADRASSGAVLGLQSQQKTDQVCMVGSSVKYMNICLQISPRGANPTNPNDNNGWLEWAVIFTREDDTDVTVTNIGLETLGVLAGRTFRQDAVFSGCMPVGVNQSNSTDIRIKIPPKMQKLVQGSKLKLNYYFRSSSSTDVRTDSHRFLASCQFKSWN